MADTKYTPRLKNEYNARIKQVMTEKFGYTNPMQMPKLDKIVLNMGIGEAVADSKKATAALKDLAAIAGQKPVITKASKSVAAFKVREGMTLGCMVTLRGARMWEFYLRLTAVALPMIRDFRGTSNRLDGRGNYSLGIADHTIFPETQADGSQRANIGMDVIIVTSANNDDEGRELLRLLGMPFRRSSAADAAAATATATKA